jgi:hypothetical protein
MHASQGSTIRNSQTREGFFARLPNCSLTVNWNQAVTHLTLLVSLVTPGLILTGCSSPLKPQTASAVIGESLQNEAVLLAVPLGRIGTACADKKQGVINQDPTADVTILAAQKAGWIEVAADGSSFWKITPLTLPPSSLEKMKESGKRLVAYGCDYQVFGFLLARKALQGIGTISQTSGTTGTAEFTWKWQVVSNGQKLLDSLSADQLKGLEPFLQYQISSQTDPRPHLADIAKDAGAHSEKQAFIRLGDGWHVALDDRTLADEIGKKLGTKHLIVEVGRVGKSCPEEDGTIDLEPNESIDTIVARKAGYVVVTPEGRDFWRVELTAKGREVFLQDTGGMFHDASKGQGCDYQEADFAVAKQAVDIRDVRYDGDTAEVHYARKWVPTDLGAMLGEKGKVYTQLAPDERNRLRRDLAWAVISPALPLPVAEEALEDGKAELTRYNERWR